VIRWSVRNPVSYQLPSRPDSLRNSPTRLFPPRRCLPTRPPRAIDASDAPAHGIIRTRYCSSAGRTRDRPAWTSSHRFGAPAPTLWSTDVARGQH